MERPIKDFTDTELKALKCDHYEDIERMRQNLAIINQELASRAQKAQENKKMDETTPEVVEETTVDESTEETAG